MEYMYSDRARVGLIVPITLGVDHIRAGRRFQELPLHRHGHGKLISKGRIAIASNIGNSESGSKC